jgi:hypothetical protein
VLRRIVKTALRQSSRMFKTASLIAGAVSVLALVASFFWRAVGFFHGTVCGNVLGAGHRAQRITATDAAPAMIGTLIPDPYAVAVLP